jgi:hypothetical protein
VLIAHLVKAEGEDYREREGEQQPVKTDKQRIRQRAGKIRRVEECLKLLHTHPATAEYPLLDGEILKCHEHAAHGDIVENYKIRQKRQSHQIYTPVGPHVAL